MATAKKIVAIVGTYRKDRVIDKQIEFCRNCRACTQEADIGRGLAESLG